MRMAEQPWRPAVRKKPPGTFRWSHASGLQAHHFQKSRILPGRPATCSPGTSGASKSAAQWGIRAQARGADIARPSCSSEEHRPGSGTGSGKRIEWPSPTLSGGYGAPGKGQSPRLMRASTRKVWEREGPTTWTPECLGGREGPGAPGEPAAMVPAPPLRLEGYESVLFLGTVEAGCAFRGTRVRCGQQGESQVKTSVTKPLSCCGLEQLSGPWSLLSLRQPHCPGIGLGNPVLRNTAPPPLQAGGEGLRNS